MIGAIVVRACAVFYLALAHYWFGGRGERAAARRGRGHLQHEGPPRQKLLDKADDDIAVVCTSGIGAALLPADESGNPLRPAILYGIDTRAEKEIRELNERYGEETLLDRCGSLLTTQAVGPKLLWLQRNEPEV